ncbi:MAG: hypothetical protein GXY08_11730 [Ruminococcus sp.]|nr:hypothetical protein [Ruminococcus sp.]
MRAAFDYCRSHSGMKLLIEPGIYHFSPEEDIYLNRLHDVLIDAKGAEFIFSTPHYFKLYACENVELRNMIVDWDWDTLRLGSLVKIENENDAENTLEIEFTELDEVDTDIPLLSFMQYDPIDLVAGVHGSFKIYSPFVDTDCIRKVEKVNGRPNALKITHSGALDYFRNDEVYLLRHYIYGAQVFNTVEESSNITFDNISIYGACGMGYVFAYGSHHYQILNSYIGLRPGAEDKYRISTTADGIHIANTNGYFRLDNCDLSFCGDDILNVHDDMFYIESIDRSRTVMKGTVAIKIVEPGHTLGFKDMSLNDISYEANVADITRNGYEATITLTEPLPEFITTDMLAYSKTRASENYVLTNNYVHETKGRGFVMNADNCLCEGNNFYRTCSQTLQSRTDIPTSHVIEGTGAEHIQISGNTFTECNFGGRGDVITVESLMNGERIGNTPLADIRILNNEFNSCYQPPVNADNADGLIVTDNIFRDCEKLQIGERCKKATVSDNKFLSKGDCNADGSFNISDVVLLQKWLLAIPGTDIADWKSCDLCRDGRLDVFDLCLMKRELVNGNY